ncbi:ABC transporter substrate-binding protein [Natronococcus pandeyae]|uniref:ABC transporter substrate-binding protein n=1 Tax=Natronococcus pandeyae TaxID=2055836 RepID=A0A8J8Q271_9EURY|nr:PGF-CTERM-anchored ABC transporter substrate-binding protein [Natronococcus pandeyae]TYL37123.1 ABC transporter substrate-binding protein [Natronococcus pandeyae]
MRSALIVFVAVLTVLAAFTPAVAAGGHAANVAQEEPTCEFPFEGEDATGEQVTIEEEPDSVVALQPSDAQILFEIGAEEKVDGMPVNEYTAYLEADEELDISDDMGSPVAEEVIDRDPDVVLAASHLANDDVVDQLRDAGLTVYVFPIEESLDDVAENVRTTGELVGECEGAAESVEWMDERLEIIEEATADEEHPLAYYAMIGSFTAGDDTFQHELMTTAGVENLGAEVGIEGWQEISEEDIIEEDPEWIIYEDSAEEPPVSESVMGTTAYQNEQFVEVDAQQFNQPGPLVVLAIEEIVQEIHPDAYAEAEAELEAGSDDADDDASDDDAADDADTDDEAADDDTIPGFGVPAAVAALLALLAGLTHRR